jgi:hypothetical protein
MPGPVAGVRRPSAAAAEERANVLDQEIGGFHGGEVAAPVELRPVDDVGGDRGQLGDRRVVEGVAMVWGRVAWSWLKRRARTWPASARTRRRRGRHPGCRSGRRRAGPSPRRRPRRPGTGCPIPPPGAGWRTRSRAGTGPPGGRRQAGSPPWAAGSVRGPTRSRNSTTELGSPWVMTRGSAQARATARAGSGSSGRRRWWCAGAPG